MKVSFSASGKTMHHRFLRPSSVAESTSASASTNTAIEGYIYLGRGHRQIISSILPLLRRLWPPFLLRYQSLSRTYNRFALYSCIISKQCSPSFTKLSCSTCWNHCCHLKSFSLLSSRRFNCTNNGFNPFVS